MSTGMKKKSILKANLYGRYWKKRYFDAISLFSPYIPYPHFYCRSTLQSDMFCDFSVVSIHGKMSVKKLDKLQE